MPCTTMYVALPFMRFDNLCELARAKVEQLEFASIGGGEVVPVHRKDDVGHVAPRLEAAPVPHLDDLAGAQGYGNVPALQQQRLESPSMVRLPPSCCMTFLSTTSSQLLTLPQAFTRLRNLEISSRLASACPTHKIIKQLLLYTR